MKRWQSNNRGFRYLALALAIVAAAVGCVQHPRTTPSRPAQQSAVTTHVAAPTTATVPTTVTSELPTTSTSGPISVPTTSPTSLPATERAATEPATLPTSAPATSPATAPATEPTTSPAAISTTAPTTSPATQAATSAPTTAIGPAPAVGPVVPGTAAGPPPEPPLPPDFIARDDRPDRAPHPEFVPRGKSRLPMMLWIIAGLFALAAVVGPVARALAPHEIPPAQSHDEPPGASGHHGRSGTLDECEE